MGPLREAQLPSTDAANRLLFLPDPITIDFMTSRTCLLTAESNYLY